MGNDREDELARNTRAQADFRMKFGIPVGLSIVATWYFISPDEMERLHIVLISLGVYIAYAVGASYLARTNAGMKGNRLAYITAVCDAIFLSVWLYTVGSEAILFVGLYTFTVLGFGFRIGNRPMFVCQAMSIAGFLWVVLASREWGTLGGAELSHLLVMVMVPLYASSLIARLNAAKAFAEYESQAKSMLLAKVSHELRTPLTGIVSAAQLIEVETQDNDIRARAQAINEMAQGLDGEIGRMLELARMEASEDVKEKSAFEISEVAGSVLRTLLPVASVKGLTLCADVDDRLSTKVMGSPKVLDGILVNLTGNAIKFTAKGSVTLSIGLVEETRSSYRIRFSVKDTGIGISEKDLPHIFEPFYQVDSGPTRRSGGTGLGTTIAMEHVKRLGGVLKIESAVNAGTRFWFEIDLEKSLETKAPRTGDVIHTIVKAKRVLIADDNRVNLELLRQMLLKDQHEVTTARSGEEALRILASETFDLVLLDFNLGDIDGATVFQTYNFGRIDTAPTYFITADTTKLTAARLADVGPRGVIYKPVSFESLRSAMRAEFGTGEPVDTAGLVGRHDENAHKRPAASSVGGQAKLRGVPVEYLDGAAIEHLRAVNDSPEFMATMLSEGIEDIAAAYERVTGSIRKGRTADVNHDGHALKGLSLSFGAVRLGALADRLMGISEKALAAEGRQLLVDLEAEFSRSVKALRQLEEATVPDVGNVKAS